MRERIGFTSELILLVGLLGAFIWNIQGKTCSIQADCQPDISCHIVPWSCNSSAEAEPTTGPTATPTASPTSTRCCVHLGSCGGQIEVAGWINVRNTSIEHDGSPYSAEWLDTFITEGNATDASVITSDYVGSWSTLKRDSISFPSQMFVAEPTNSCTVDGEPKWPEWYQVTVNVIAKYEIDDSLYIESDCTKDCLCDVEWDCLNNLCYIETQNTSRGGANLSKTDTLLESNVAGFCRSSANVTVVNYTASSYFAVGFGPDQSEVDTFNFNTSVEGGWGPDLDDTDIWIQLHLDEDTMISGILIQGMAVNPERRVDEFKVEYEASDAGAQTIGPDTVFKAGARLDTKMINSFPQPVKANKVKLLIQKPCDPYYIGLRLELLGCAPCEVSDDCTDNGICEPEKFCTYEVSTIMPTTEMPTATGATTGPITTPLASPTMGTTEPITSDMPTTPVITNSPVVTTASADTTAVLTTPAVGTTAGGSATTLPQATAGETTTVAPAQQIEAKINSYPPEVQTGLNALILDVSSDSLTTFPVENLTENVITAGLDVIKNITTKANTTENDRLQQTILQGAWNFIVVVSGSDAFTADGQINTELFNQMMDVSSLILDVDRKEAWMDVQKESVAGPLAIVSSVEAVAISIAVASSTASITNPININQGNIEGAIIGKAKTDLTEQGFTYSFPSQDPTLVETSVTISMDAFAANEDVKQLSGNSTLAVVVLQFSSIAELLGTDSVEDKTDNGGQTKRLGSSILSISVVGDGTFSLPVTFKLGHDEVQGKEDQRCNFWLPEPDSKVSGSWSATGCETAEKKLTSSKCICSHMTNYAVLMWLGSEPPPEDDSTKYLTIITTVGCLVSICTLAVAIALLFYLKSSLSSERIIIHMHLMSVTLIALILYLAGIDQTENELLCQLITVGLHFFYMSMFSWMLVEGIHLYRQIIAVFESGKSRFWVYFIIGWGIPVIVVGITSGIFFNDYKNHTFCWLDVKDGSIWGFMGPLIPILLVNLVVLFMVSRIVISAAKLQQEKPGFSSAKAGLRSSLLLLPILGVTWVFGYFASSHIALQYAFVGLNAFQGFFMALFHCFMSSEVNTALKQKIRKVKESSIGGVSTIDSLHPKCLMSAEKSPLYEVISTLDTGVDIPYNLYEYIDPQAGDVYERN